MRYRIVRVNVFLFTILLPIGVFLTSDYIFEELGFFQLTYSQRLADSLRNANGVLALSQRYNYLATTLAYLVVSVTCIALCLLDLKNRFSIASLALIAFGLFSIGLVVFVVVIFLPSTGASHRTYEVVGPALFEQSLRLMLTDSLAFPTLWSAYEVLLRVNSFLALGVTALLICGATAIACSDPQPLPTEPRPLLTRLQRQADDFKRYIYLSSIFLVCGVLQMQSWLDLPSFAFDAESGRSDFERLASSVTRYYATTFSLILIAFAVPGLFVMRSHSEKLIAQTLDPNENTYHETLSGRMKGLGFGLFSIEGMQSVLAVLAPVIAGSLDFTKLLSG